MTTPETMRGRFDKKFPCKNATCDNNGTVETIIGDYERDLEQCQYCDIERFPILAFIESELALREAHHKALRAKELGVTEDTSDGYHTFKELYEFRLLYNSALFNEWALQGKYNVHKSQRHFDGELCFGRNDYFVVVATLPTGQISNHYPMSEWDLFKCAEVEKALAQWDGHTSQDVAKRLRELIEKP